MDLHLAGPLSEVSKRVVEPLDLLLLILLQHRRLLKIELHQLCCFGLVPYVISIHVDLMLSV